MYTSLLEDIYIFLAENIGMPNINIHTENINLVPLSNIDYRDKISGAMMALAISDAYSNLLKTQQLKEIGQTVYILKDYKSTNILNDIEKTKAVILFAESLIINQCFNPEDLSNRLVRNIDLIEDKTVKQFITNYKDNKLEWYNSGIPSLENDCVIRCVPAALISYGDFTTLKLISSIQTAITNIDEAAIAASILFCTAIAYLLNTPAFSLQSAEDLNKFIDFLTRSIKGIETKVYTVGTSNEIANLYIMINNMLRQWIDNKIPVVQIVKQWGCNNNVLQSIPLSIYIFIKNCNEYEKIIEECLNIKENESIIIMTLTLLGAYLGFNNIPKIYTNKLKISNEILVLSNRLFELSLKNKNNNPYRRMKDQIKEEPLQDELDKLLWSAIKHNKEEQYGKAIQYFEELVLKSPDFKKNERVRLHIIESYGGLGNQLLENEQYEEALRCFKKALVYDLNNPAILCGIAVTYLNMDSLNKAERYARRAVEIAPEYEIGREILEGIKSLQKKS